MLDSDSQQGKARNFGTRTLSDWALQSLQRSYRMPPASFLPELPNTGISLTRWRRALPSPSHLIESPNASYTLSLILKPMRARAWFGATEVWAGPIGANTIRLTPPGLKPCWQSSGAFDFLLFTIPRQTIDRIAGADALRFHESLSGNRPLYIRDDIVVDIARNMLSACGSNGPYMRHFADGLGYALVAHLLDRYMGSANTVQSGLSPLRLQRVHRHIAEHLGEEICVGDLARIAELSPSHFAHVFRASTGASPHRSITAARIERARQMLKDDRKSVAEISVECGFRNASHFARVFRTVVGVTPRAFRNRCS